MINKYKTLYHFTHLLGPLMPSCIHIGSGSAPLHSACSALPSGALSQFHQCQLDAAQQYSLIG